VGDVKMHKKISTREITTNADLCRLVDKCARVEEAQELPGEARPEAGYFVKKKNHMKQYSKQVLDGMPHDQRDVQDFQDLRCNMETPTIGTNIYIEYHSSRRAGRSSTPGCPFAKIRSMHL
jgi:hypothetical protein